MIRIIWSRSRARITICLAFLLAITASLASANVPVQDGLARPARVISKLTSPFEPVLLTNAKARGKAIRFEMPSVDDDQNWLQGLSVQVRNISERAITYVSIELRVDPPESGNLPRITSFSAGSLPLSGDGLLPTAEKLILPGRSIDIKFPDEKYLRYREYLQVDNVKISIGKVFFEDDTLWMGGVLYTRDPKNSNRWNPVESSVRNLEESYRERIKQQSQSLVRPDSVFTSLRRGHRAIPE